MCDLMEASTDTVFPAFNINPFNSFSSSNYATLPRMINRLIVRLSCWNSFLYFSEWVYIVIKLSFFQNVWCFWVLPRYKYWNSLWQNTSWSNTCVNCSEFTKFLFISDNRFFASSVNVFRIILKICHTQLWQKFLSDFYYFIYMVLTISDSRKHVLV